MLRRPSIILWLAAYAAISLCGPALHELTGGGHDRRSAARGTDAKAGMHGDPTTPVASASVADTDDDGHCPVCSYLAQAQAAPEAPSTATRGLVEISTEARPAAGPKPGSPLPSRPRAPPRPPLAHA